jgi:hypothetical protein
MRAPVAVAVAMAIGLIILLGYFLPFELFPSLAFIKDIQVLFLGWAAILAGVAALIAILNLASVHWHKLRAKKNRDWYSFFLLLAFLITLGAGLAYGPTDRGFQRVVTSIQSPIETSLLAVLVITLSYASMRLIQRRKGWMALIFIASAIVFLILDSATVSFLRTIPVVGGIVYLVEGLPQAGARGILLGIGLGSLATGIRILMGADRPYSG